MKNKIIYFVDIDIFYISIEIKGKINISCKERKGGKWFFGVMCKGVLFLFVNCYDLK